VRPAPVAAALAALALWLAPGVALAACTISASGVSFGSYNVFSDLPRDATGTVTYQCSPIAVNVQIQLNRGGASSFDPRQMRQGAATLDYNLYIDLTRTTIWGDGTGGTQVYTALAGVFIDIVVPIFGRIPARQNVPAGSYLDTITATIIF